VVSGEGGADASGFQAGFFSKEAQEITKATAAGRKRAPLPRRVDFRDARIFSIVLRTPPGGNRAPGRRADSWARVSDDPFELAGALGSWCGSRS
jgi:hypothetical protein